MEARDFEREKEPENIREICELAIANSEAEQQNKSSSQAKLNKILENQPELATKAAVKLAEDPRNNHAVFYLINNFKVDTATVFVKATDNPQLQNSLLSQKMLDKAKAILVAAEENNEQLVATLLTENPLLLIEAIKGAARGNQKELLKTLLASNNKILSERKLEIDLAIVANAAFNGHQKIINDKLLEYQPTDIVKGDLQKVAAKFAILGKHIALAEIIIANAPPIDKKIVICGAMYGAGESDNLKLALSILNQYSTKNTYHDFLLNAMLGAAAKGNIKLIEELFPEVDKGLQPTMLKSIIMHAAQHDQRNLLHHLLKKASGLFKDERVGKELLYTALKGAFVGNHEDSSKEILAKILEQKPDPEELIQQFKKILEKTPSREKRLMLISLINDKTLRNHVAQSLGYKKDIKLLKEINDKIQHFLLTPENAYQVTCNKVLNKDLLGWMMHYKRLCIDKGLNKDIFIKIAATAAKLDTHTIATILENFKIRMARALLHATSKRKTFPLFSKNKSQGIIVTETSKKLLTARTQDDLENILEELKNKSHSLYLEKIWPGENKGFAAKTVKDSKYHQNYIFVNDVNNNNAKKLYYIREDGLAEKIKISKDKMQQLEDALERQFKPENQCISGSKELQDLITKYTGHDPAKRIERVKGFVI